MKPQMNTKKDRSGDPNVLKTKFEVFPAWIRQILRCKYVFQCNKYRLLELLCQSTWQKDKGCPTCPMQNYLDNDQRRGKSGHGCYFQNCGEAMYIKILRVEQLKALKSRDEKARMRAAAIREMRQGQVARMRSLKAPSRLTRNVVPEIRKEARKNAGRTRKSHRKKLS